MKEGLYALASLNGAPHDPASLRRLGLSETASSVAARIVDTGADGVGSGMDVSGGATTVLVGFIEDEDTFARRLGQPPHTPPVRLARLALEREGEDVLMSLAGGWSLLHADGRGRVILACSADLRDPIYYATDGRRLAVAPSMGALADLAWVGGEFDRLPMLMSMSSWSFRSRLRSQTWLKEVRRVRHGGAAVVTTAAVREIEPIPRFPTEAPWTGSFEEGVAELDRVCRRVVKGHLNRHGDAAVQLSGGLDSSLLAYLCMDERRAGQKVFAVTSVAPPGSGLADEAAFAHLAARHLGMELVEVSPRPDESPYLPPLADRAYLEGPSYGPRHDLYRALEDAAHAAGATAMFDGGLGELSVTRRCALATPTSRLRHIVRTMRALRRPRSQWPDAGFGVQLAPRALAFASAAFGREDPSEKRDALTPSSRPLGPLPGLAKLGRGETSTRIAGLRTVSPFQSVCPIALVARFPARFTEEGGLPRALARAMMRDAMPEAIVRRTRKFPISPAYEIRLQQHAAVARSRIALHRLHGAGEWLDLDWLDGGLARIAEYGAGEIGLHMRIQATALAAEFFTWWSDRTLE